jgi:hypothetical protein
LILAYKGLFQQKHDQQRRYEYYTARFFSEDLLTFLQKKSPAEAGLYKSTIPGNQFPLHIFKSIIMPFSIEGYISLVNLLNILYLENNIIASV